MTVEFKAESYTVTNGAGEKIAVGCDREDAVRECLQHDGGQYDIREEANGSFRLYTRNQTAGRDWVAFGAVSHAASEDAARTEIFDFMFRNNSFSGCEIQSDRDWIDGEIERVEAEFEEVKDLVDDLLEDFADVAGASAYIAAQFKAKMAELMEDYA